MYLVWILSAILSSSFSPTVSDRLYTGRQSVSQPTIWEAQLYTHVMTRLQFKTIDTLHYGVYIIHHSIDHARYIMCYIKRNVSASLYDEYHVLVSSQSKMFCFSLHFIMLYQRWRFFLFALSYTMPKWNKLYISLHLVIPYQKGIQCISLLHLVIPYQKGIQCISLCT